MIRINGKDFNVAGTSVAKYLKDNGYDEKRVAVEINERIVPKGKYEETTFSDGDIIEVVSFVGGG